MGGQIPRGILILDIIDSGKEYLIRIEHGGFGIYSKGEEATDYVDGTNFGEDANLLMTKMVENSAVNLQKPYVLGVNTSNKGIVHSLDGSTKYGPQYTTNDINLLPDWATAAYRNSETGRLMGDGYLGGV